MSNGSGISIRGRAELTKVLGTNPRFVAPSDLANVLGIDAATAAKKLARWAAEGWLRRARRGLYIPVPVDAANPSSWSEDALIVATAVWSPCYFTGWTAANYWSLTDQVFRTTVVKTSHRVRSSSARMLDHDYVLAHISQKHMEWGIKTEWHGEVKLLIADAARTVIDIFDLPRLGGGIRHGAEILATFLDDHDPKVLIDWETGLSSSVLDTSLRYLARIAVAWSRHVVIACPPESRLWTLMGHLEVGA